MITINNYTEKTQNIDFSALPDALQKGDDLAKKALSNNMQAYNSNDTIKRVVDNYIEKLNAFQKSNPQQIAAKPTVRKKANTKTASTSRPQSAKKTPAPKPKPSPKPSVAKKRVAKAPKAVDTSKKVELIPVEIAFIKRYAALSGKVRTKKSMLAMLSSLQKAMLEKRIRKTSPYAKEIMQIQTQLISAVDKMDDSAEISIEAKNLKRYQEIASSERIRESIALLKRYLSIHGKPGVEEKALRLKNAMERMVKSGKISKADPYSDRLNAAFKSLAVYLREKKATPAISQGELNGIKGLLGAHRYSSTSKKKESPGLQKSKDTVSSQELMRMDFETIGLKGKFRELIGDPSVGFTAMVFGQPKSGKSTLMLEFANELASKHGPVLYAAIEEGYGYTLKDKIQRVKATHPELYFAEKLPGNLSAYDFVFIDSVSRAGMELSDMVKLKNKYPRIGFVFVFHSTKDGKFRGGNELAHEVDVIITVENKMATASGRFNGGGSLKMG